MKDKVLEILEENKGKSISGSEIARRLGLTRAAVWKSIKSLQDDGFQITAVTNKGYCLTAGNDIITEPGIRKYLSTHTIGNKIVLYKTTDSTNIRAKQAAQNQAPSGLVVIAEEQNAGRGRFGRHFYSPKQNGVYLSVLVRPNLDIEYAPLITAAASICVAQAIEAVSDVSVSIKWVNDLFVDGRKVCGILTEAGLEFESRKLDYVVIGIGVNIAADDLPEELQEIVGGISKGTARPERNRLIAEILNRLEEMFHPFSPERFLSEYRKRSNVIGRRISVLQGEQLSFGTALEIDDMARLVVKFEDGTIQALHSGEISCRVL